MLYILQLSILLIWLIVIIKKYRYSPHAILTAYFFFVMLVDVMEGTLSYFFGFYKFSPHLLANPDKDNVLGLVFCDGYILPITGILLCHYATKVKSLWRLSLAYAVIYGVLELLYVKMGYLNYQKWSIWVSIIIYFLATRIFTIFASGFMLYDPPLPYSVRIAGATYALTVYIGAYISSGLIGLYEWRPLIIRNPPEDDRFVSLAASIILALLIAAAIPKIKFRLRPIVLILFSMLMAALSYFAYHRGWLTYHHWNHLLMALYWLVSFSALAWYDHWESPYKGKHNKN